MLLRGHCPDVDVSLQEIGSGVYRFKAEVAWNGEAVVQRYLDRWALGWCSAGSGEERRGGEVRGSLIRRIGCGGEERVQEGGRRTVSRLRRCGRERLLGRLTDAARRGDTAVRAVARIPCCDSSGNSRSSSSNSTIKRAGACGCWRCRRSRWVRHGEP